MPAWHNEGDGRAGTSGLGYGPVAGRSRAREGDDITHARPADTAAVPPARSRRWLWWLLGWAAIAAVLGGIDTKWLSLYLIVCAIVALVALWIFANVDQPAAPEPPFQAWVRRFGWWCLWAVYGVAMVAAGAPDGDGLKVGIAYLLLTSPLTGVTLWHWGEQRLHRRRDRDSTMPAGSAMATAAAAEEPLPALLSGPDAAAAGAALRAAVGGAGQVGTGVAVLAVPLSAGVIFAILALIFGEFIGGLGPPWPTVAAVVGGILSLVAGGVIWAGKVDAGRGDPIVVHVRVTGRDEWDADNLHRGVARLAGDLIGGGKELPVEVLGAWILRSTGVPEPLPAWANEKLLTGADALGWIPIGERVVLICRGDRAIVARAARFLPPPGPEPAAGS